MYLIPLPERVIFKIKQVTLTPQLCSGKECALENVFLIIRELDMTINLTVRLIAGCFILISLALGAPASPVFHSSYWLWFTVFVGANLFQSGLTKWCLMDKILKKLGVPES